MTDDVILYTVENNVATITFNRPENQNTISGPMLSKLSELLIESDAAEEVRAIVITGTGKFFCAGLDLRGSDITENLTKQEKKPANIDLRNTPPTVLHNLDTPTIAAINGSAAGYGMDLALGCDIRIMTDGAKLAAAFTSRGVVPESGGTWILPRLIGWSKASEIIFTGKTLTAQESEEMGLISKVVNNNEIYEEAAALASKIAKNAPLAVQVSKRMMRMGLNENFDDAAKEEFLKGAKIAYETIITDFASGNLKNIKMLLDKKIYTQFSEAVNERTEKGHISETTFIGINSAKIQKHEKKENVLEVTVEFVSEIISSLKDKEKNILSGDPKKIKTVQDCWKFSKDIRSSSPNWLLIDTQA